MTIDRLSPPPIFKWYVLSDEISFVDNHRHHHLGPSKIHLLADNWLEISLHPESNIEIYNGQLQINIFPVVRLALGCFPGCPTCANKKCLIRAIRAQIMCLNSLMVIISNISRTFNVKFLSKNSVNKNISVDHPNRYLERTVSIYSYHKISPPATEPLSTGSSLMLNSWNGPRRIVSFSFRPSDTLKPR